VMELSPKDRRNRAKVIAAAARLQGSSDESGTPSDSRQ
jgi:hypothetical protein